MQNLKVQATVDKKSNKKPKTIVQEKKADKAGCMGSYDEECSNSSDQAVPTSQSEESHLSMITYSYSPAPAPGGWASASSIEEQPTFEDSTTSLTLTNEFNRRYDHICFKKCSNILKAWEKELEVGKYSEEKKERGSRHFFFTQLRRFFKKIGIEGLAKREQLFVKEMKNLIQKEEFKQQKDGDNQKSKQYILEFSRAIEAYRLFVKEEYQEAFKAFYGFKEPGFKQKKKMENAFKQFKKKLAEEGQPTGSEQENLGQQSEILADMINHSVQIEMIQLETDDSEEIETLVQLEYLLSEEELTSPSISEIETELLEVDFDYLSNEYLNEDESFNDLLR